MLVKLRGGSLMVWGIISSEGLGPLVRLYHGGHGLYGKVNAEVYKQILQQHGISNLRLVANQPPIFMQDNMKIVMKQKTGDEFL